MTIQNIIYKNTGVMVEKNEMRNLVMSTDVSKLRGVGICYAFPAIQSI